MLQRSRLCTRSQKSELCNSLLYSSNLLAKILIVCFSATFHIFYQTTPLYLGRSGVAPLVKRCILDQPGLGTPSSLHTSHLTLRTPVQHALLRSTSSPSSLVQITQHPSYIAEHVASVGVSTFASELHRMSQITTGHSSSRRLSMLQFNSSAHR